MQLNLEHPEFDYVLRGADGRQALVNDRRLTRSFIVAPRTLVEDWPAADVRTLDIDALAPVLALEPEVVLIGTGDRQGFPPAATMARFSQPSVCWRRPSPPFSSTSCASKCERMRTGRATAGANRICP